MAIDGNGERGHRNQTQHSSILLTDVVFQPHPLLRTFDPPRSTDPLAPCNIFRRADHHHKGPRAHHQDHVSNHLFSD